MKQEIKWAIIAIVVTIVLTIFIARYPSISYPGRDAKIEIISQDKIEIYSFLLVRTSDTKGDFSKIIFRNSGDIDANVFCSQTTNDNFTGTILNEDNGVSPIEVSKESYEYRRLRITYNLCSSQTDHCDKPELVPIGKHSITFNCECHACKKQRNFNQTIHFAKHCFR